MQHVLHQTGIREFMLFKFTKSVRAEPVEARLKQRVLTGPVKTSCYSRASTGSARTLVVLSFYSDTNTKAACAARCRLHVQ
jgi:hypothetical protein